MTNTIISAITDFIFVADEPKSNFHSWRFISRAA